MQLLRIWNRSEKCEMSEPIYGESSLRLVYAQRVPGRVLSAVLTRRVFSRILGLYQSSVLSRRNINPFVARLQIDKSQFEERYYHSFNDFFIRRFREGVRKFGEDPNLLPAFAEGRLLAFGSVLREFALPIKGAFISLETLLGGMENAARFVNGPCFIARLCPQDYHRFHYPDDGKTVAQWRIPGPLHSVNPIALSRFGGILCNNDRCISLLDTLNFGTLAFVEVGALCVGKIVQTQPPDYVFKRGAEKGYFEFGASTVILLGESGKWAPDLDLLERTGSGWETFVRLGEPIARRI